MNWKHITQGLIAALLLNYSAHSVAAEPANSEVNLHRYSLVSLHSNDNISLSHYKDKILLISFFEPNCKWCYKQMKVLNQLQESCKHSVQPVAVGVHGRRSELKQELRKAKVNYPAFIASDELLQATGAISSTPITLIISDKGEFIAPLTGYIPLKTLNEIFPSCRA